MITLSISLVLSDYPSAPSVDLDVQLTDIDNSTFTFILSWFAPYSFPGFPITGYTITITNYSSSEAFARVLTTTSNETEYRFNTSGDECYRLDLSVSANNSLGEGESSTIQSGHPVVGNAHVIILSLNNYYYYYNH